MERTYLNFRKLRSWWSDAQTDLRNLLIKKKKKKEDKLSRLMKRMLGGCSVTFCTHTESQVTSADGYTLRNKTKPLLSAVVL